MVSYRYTPYGDMTITRGGVAQAADPLGQYWGYTGRFSDEETELWYYRARYYDGATGRMLQRDPAGYAEGPGLYQYVDGRPVTFSDPSGLGPEWANLSDSVDSVLSSMPVSDESDSGSLSGNIDFGLAGNGLSSLGVGIDIRAILFFRGGSFFEARGTARSFFDFSPRSRLTTPLSFGASFGIPIGGFSSGSSSSAQFSMIGGGSYNSNGGKKSGYVGMSIDF